ncbi:MULTISPECIES: aspartate aminotransferase family protein [Actinomycetes]|uniref:Aspartate aminotransferase family protein n=2 Tax=Actinomycetes TaxID=1760 RepID=A0ABP6LUU1_9MICC
MSTADSSPVSAPGQTPATAALLRRRRDTLGPHSPLFYEEPLHLASGAGVWLTAADGTEYLDGYNNVPHVGHANPRVQQAICDQAGRLNVHTRYLQDRVVEYAERLLATFDTDLDRLFLTNSGSEANELALRLATQHTGARGVLVTDFSYHGNTRSLAELTTGLAVGEEFGDHVRAFHVPDTVTATGVDPRSLLESSAAQLDAALGSLQEAGHGVAALLVDPLFSTEGMPEPPDGWTQMLGEKVRAAGGLVIADEVQSGFGRLGGAMWGHQAVGLDPDLVTMGKPMGNGHPMGGVVTTAELLDEFGRRNMYFNTFAGNPVSSAAGLAVLEEMEDRRLMAHAAELGARVHRQLEEIASGTARISARRGSGLFFGLEIIDDDGSPDARATKRLVEEMKRRRLLISRIGPQDNVLKIRPPMVIEDHEAQLLLEGLAESVATVLR